MRRPAFYFFLLVFGFLVPTLLAVWLALDATPGKFRLKGVDFSSLTGWNKDDKAGAFEAFLKSCDTVKNRFPTAILPGISPQRLQQAFIAVCKIATQGLSENFFEENFDLYQLSVGWKGKGLLTGYYEPLLEVSLAPSPNYPIPIYRNPGDQITIDLGQFRKDLEGTHLVGRLVENRLVPYHSRADIEAGALEGKGLELLWAKNPVDVFFLQIQGSGRALLPDGSFLRIGYAGKNGHPYTSIGRVLAEEGHLKLDKVSLYTIRQWLSEHPAQITEILNRNASYVFFRELAEDGPIGSAGAVLTPTRSLAVDPRFIPLGLPVWISGDMPDPSDPEEKTLPFHHVLIAQDTGGAIKGELRGDVFWGFGERAETLAGYMKHEARFYLLVPKGTLPKD